MGGKMTIGENENLPLAPQVSEKKCPDVLVGKQLEKVLNNFPGEVWRKWFLHRLYKKLGTLKNKKLSKITKADLKKAIGETGKTNVNNQTQSFVWFMRLTIDGVVPPTQKYTRKTMASTEGTAKLKHFVMDLQEAKDVLALKNGRFSDLRNEVREQLSVLPAGKVYGVQMPEDAKEVNSIRHTLGAMFKDLKMEFTMRYLKPKNILAIFRTTDITKGEN